jgi:pimeloyl-ACP methyl ester carboxylesterase
MTDFVEFIDASTGMPCVQAGGGDCVVLVHGALADARMWRPHQALLAPRWRTLAVTLRHFGASPSAPGAEPADAAPAFGIATHAQDLARCIAGLGCGPVHLVAWSYSAHAALHLASLQPQLLRSVFVYEPGFPTYVTDPQAMAAFAEDAAQMYGPLGTALEQGDLERATQVLMDASGQRPGYFAAQPATRQRIQRDNAHTLPLLMGQTPPPAISAQDLRAIAVPTCVARGAETRAVFGVVADAAAQAMPQARRLVVPGGTHMWPDEQPAAFCAALEDFWRDPAPASAPPPAAQGACQ